MKSFSAMNSPRIPWMASLLGFALVSGVLAQGDSVTATVAPKMCEISKIQPGKPWSAVITYVVRNRSDHVQVLSRYCTIRLTASENGLPLELKCQGRDGTRLITAADIVVLKPGDAGELTARIYVATLRHGKFIVFRSTEDGTSWATDPLTIPVEIELRGTYDLSFVRAQSGFRNVEKDEEALARRSTDANFELVQNLELPPVAITVTDRTRQD